MARSNLTASKSFSRPAAVFDAMSASKFNILNSPKDILCKMDCSENLLVIANASYFAQAIQFSHIRLQIKILQVP